MGELVRYREIKYFPLLLIFDLMPKLCRYGVEDISVRELRPANYYGIKDNWILWAYLEFSALKIFYLWSVDF